MGTEIESLIRPHGSPHGIGSLFLESRKVYYGSRRNYKFGAH